MTASCGGMEFLSPSSSLTSVVGDAIPSEWLADSDNQNLLKLFSSLTIGTNDYLAIQECITIFRKGVASYRASDSSKECKLIAILRWFREYFRARFSPSECMWVAWLTDEISLSNSVEARANVIELGYDAVGNMPFSFDIWWLFCQTVTRWYTEYSDPSTFESIDPNDLSMGQELFDWKTVCAIWEAAIAAVMENLSASATQLILTFVSHATKRLEDLGNSLLDSSSRTDSELDAESHSLRQCVCTVLEQRLERPCMAWNSLSQQYSEFVTRWYPAHEYENMMVRITRRAAPGKAIMAQRADFETKLADAAHDTIHAENVLYTEWKNYASWEMRHGCRKVRECKRKRYRDVDSLRSQFEQAYENLAWIGRVVNLFERFLCRFDTESIFWVELVEWIIAHEDEFDSAATVQKAAENRGLRGLSMTSPPRFDLCAILKRATSHCPWSGTLWSYYLIVLRCAGKPFEDLKTVMESATFNGILELGSSEELIQFYLTWCSILRECIVDANTRDHSELSILYNDMDNLFRKALNNVRNSIEVAQPESVESRYTDENGISSPMSDRLKNGNSIPKFTGDPQGRLEISYAQFLVAQGDIEFARQVLMTLCDTCNSQFSFWNQWYTMELRAWQNEPDENVPHESTRVLELAMKYLEVIDYPELVVELYTTHCETYESTRYLGNMIIKAKHARQIVDERRKTESITMENTARNSFIADDVEIVSDGDKSTDPIDTSATATTTVNSEDYVKPDLECLPDTPSSHEDVDMLTPPDSQSLKRHSVAKTKCRAKRVKFNEPIVTEQRASLPVHNPSTNNNDNGVAKRDREHTSIIVQGIPQKVEEKGLRQFFRGCGNIRSILLVSDDNDTTKTGYVEFEAREDAMFALSRSTRSLNGVNVNIQLAESSTLWLANYPSEADEKALSQLLSPFGRVLQVRLPSLAKNAHRRFCYVTMASNEAAQKAVENLDGTKIMDKVMLRELTLVCRISNPDRRKAREGALFEGREVVLKNWHYDGTELELRAFVIDIIREELGESDDFKKWSSAIERVRVPLSASGKGKGSGFVVFHDAKLAVQACGLLNGREFRGRKLTAELARADYRAPRITSTCVLDVETNRNTEPSESVQKQRSITIWQLSPTTSSAQLQYLTKSFGGLRKVSLRPEKGNAVVEYIDEAAAGRAALSLDGFLFQGRTLRVKLGIFHGIEKQDTIESNGTVDPRMREKQKTRLAFVARGMPIRRPGEVKRGVGLKTRIKTTAIPSISSSTSSGDNNNLGASSTTSIETNENESVEPLTK